MKVIELAAPHIDSLRSSTYSDPIAGLGDVLIRLRAASLNFLHIAVATGKYPLNNFPIIPVTDGAGEIAPIGTAVTDWEVGERVIPRVSLFAMQFAKAHGARVLVTSSSVEKLERARKLGTDEVINYKSTPRWADEVLRLTEGRGADLVLETGGTATFPQSIEAAGLDSTVFIIGFLSGTEVSISVVPAMERRIRLQGNNTIPVADLADSAAAMTAYRIKPVLDARFPMDQAEAAYQHLAEGGHFGKVAIVIP